MKRLFLNILFASWAMMSFALSPDDYIWREPSVNSSESMPLGGGDIGMNVWVENGDILFYISRTGSYDENNTLLKQGRFRIKTIPSIFEGSSHFKQNLSLNDGVRSEEHNV